MLAVGFIFLPLLTLASHTPGGPFWRRPVGWGCPSEQDHSLVPGPAPLAWGRPAPCPSPLLSLAKPLLVRGTVCLVSRELLLKEAIAFSQQVLELVFLWGILGSSENVFSLAFLPIFSWFTAAGAPEAKVRAGLGRAGVCHLDCRGKCQLAATQVWQGAC